METAVVYPVPIETAEVRELFLPAFERFASTWRQFPPGVDCVIYAVHCGEVLDDKICAIFDGLPVKFIPYAGNGFDFGAQQEASQHLEGCFQVNMTSRVYFHREGWLKRLVDHREQFGPNLYGTSVSNEGGRLHLCTRCFAADADQFAAYPHKLDTRDKGVFYEVGIGNPDGSLAEWFEVTYQQVPYVVYWHQAYPWRQHHGDAHPGLDNVFRRGDQTELLVWDRHTKLWADADDQEKKRLTSLCYEPLPC